MRKSQSLILGAVALALPVVGSAITVRDNVTEAQSIAFASQSQFASVGEINGASGVLISDQWVLTAWHVVVGAAGNPSSLNFRVGGTDYQASEVRLLADAAANFNDVLVDGRDLALVRLTNAVVGVNPAQLYTGSSEIGNTASIIGFGNFGTGSGGSIGGSGGVKRGMRNSLDLYTVNLGGGNIDGSTTRTGSILSDFDNNTSGANQTGTPNWLDLEGNLAGGDSGGAMFIESNGQYQLAGINSFVAGPNGVPLAGYSYLSGYTSVSWNQQWIASTTAVPEPGTMLVLAGLGAVAARRRLKK
ncbi:MAG: trypsin-like serine protease [Fimbriimonadaceae bacterium]